jgi:hypothetical protein
VLSNKIVIGDIEVEHSAFIAGVGGQTKLVESLSLSTQGEQRLVFKNRNEVLCLLDFVTKAYGLEDIILEGALENEKML